MSVFISWSKNQMGSTFQAPFCICFCVFINMGIGKSKQAFSPSARTVLSRRKMELDGVKMTDQLGEKAVRPSAVSDAAEVAEAAQGVRDITPSNKIKSSAPAQPVAEKENVNADGAQSTIDRINNHVPTEDGMNPDILKEMSTWATVKSEVDQEALQLRKNGKSTMATVIRHKEESSIMKKYGKSPEILSGRLSENQLFELLNITLSAKNTDISKLAKDFQVSHTVLETILSSVRAPIFQEPLDGDKEQEEGQIEIKIAR